MRTESEMRLAVRTLEHAINSGLFTPFAVTLMLGEATALRYALRDEVASVGLEDALAAIRDHMQRAELHAVGGR